MKKIFSTRHSLAKNNIILETCNLLQIIFAIICLIAGGFCCIVCNSQSETVLNTI